ncbi:MAG: hypothetical protein ABI548_11020 [Polyangiaceae bacterium]
MARTIAALDPLTGTRALLVEVHRELTSPSHAVVAAFEERMFVRNVRVGLLVTPSKTLVLRDTLSSMQVPGNKYEVHEVQTADLLAGARVAVPVEQSEEAFTRQVVQMLEAVGSSWYTFLHPSAVTSMVPDVVGNLAQANLEVWDGVLEREDAAE